MESGDCLTILNVNGDAAARRCWTRVLEGHGFGVEEAGAGGEALRIAREKRIDLALLDLHLPAPGSADVYRRLRNQSPLLPVVCMGAPGADGLPGAEACLPAQVAPDLLVSTLRAVLRTGPEAAPTAPAQPYGDLTALNRTRVVADAVGGILADIATDYLDALETSTAIYEKNGDYALGLMHSRWCRLLDMASRDLCGTPDNREALASGRWICHEDCWRSARQAIETGQPVDMRCAGGLRLYAVPIFANGDAVGAMNFGYGEPPRDLAELEAVAKSFRIDVETLRKEAEAYRPRAPEAIENAKRRLRVSARLAGALIARKQAEQAAHRAADRISSLRDLATAVSEAVTTEQVLDAVMERMMSLAGAQSAVIALLDANHELVAARIAGYDAQDSPGGFPLCQAVSEAIRLGDAILWEAPEGGNIAALPLMVRHEAIGGLAMRLAQPRRSYAEVREFMMTVGRTCGQAVERARLYDAQQRAREDLSAQNRRLEELAAVLPAPVIVCSGPAHTIEFINPANLALWAGRNPVGQRLRDAYPEFKTAGYAALWDRVYRTGEPFHAREACISIDRGTGRSEDRYFDLSLVPRHDDGGNVVGVLSFSVDVTGQVVTRQQLEARRGFISTVLNQMPVGVAIAEAKTGLLVFSNGEAQHLLGACLPSRVSPGSSNPVEAALARAGEGEGTTQDEVVCACPCPATYFSISAAPIRGADGEIVAAACAFQDISSRKNAQSMLRQQAQMINLSHDAIITATPGHVITGWNAGAEEMYGWTAAEAVGQKTYELIGKGRAIAEIDAYLRREGRWDGVLHNQRRDGTPVIAESRQVLVQGADGKPAGILKINRDVTRREQAMAALRESEEWRKFTQRAAGIGIVDWDLVNHSAKYSGNFFALYGLEGAKIDPTIEGWLGLVHPEDRKCVARRVEPALERCQPFDVEFRILKPDGSTAWLAAKGAVFADKEGRLERAIAAQMDVTDRRRAEEAHNSAQKLESVGLLAGGVAHDFNNLLTTVLGHASLLLTEVPPAARRSVEAIIAGSERAAELTRQLLAYAGKARFHIEDADLSTLVQEMADLVRLSIAKSIELRLDLAGNLPAIKTDAGQFQQVLMNLVMNAAEAIGESKTGTVSISTAERSVDGPLAVRPGEELAPGLYCCLEVTDTGCGMEPGTAVRIFEPFFSTKFLGRGLGLAAVAGIMRSHNGAITVRSAPGRGTTFTVYFPATGAPAHMMLRENTAGDAQGTGTVLVVDDEDMVRHFIVRALEEYGYETVEASNGADALAAIEQSPQIGIVLLDVVMPVMGGGSALSEIKRRRADLPVLVTSGYNEAEAQRLCAPHGSIQFIQKPYTAEQLAARVKAVMGKRNGPARPEPDGLAGDSRPEPSRP